MSNKEFIAVFSLLVGFGTIVIITLFLFGKREYLLFTTVAQGIILLNLVLWRYLFFKSFFSGMLKNPIFLLFIYVFKFAFILLVLYGAYSYFL